MSILKKVQSNYDLAVGDSVRILHHVERDYNSAHQISDLKTKTEDEILCSGPSYSVNNDTTYYVGCGIITKIFKNETCNVKFQTK